MAVAAGMHSMSLAMLLAMLAVFAWSAVATSHSQLFRQQSTLVVPALDIPNSVHVHDVTGPVILNFYSPSSPASLPAGMSNARPGSQTIASVFIALFIHRLLRVVSHQLSKYIISTLARKHTQRGCKAAVSDCEQRPTTTSIKRHAYSLGEANDLGPVALPQEPSLMTGSATPGHLLHSGTFPTSGSFSVTSSSIDATSSAHGRGPCIYHRRGCTGRQNKESIIRPNASVCRSYPSIRQAIAGDTFSLENIESPSPSGHNPPTSSRSFTSYPLADNDASSGSNFVNPTIVRGILALSILVIGLDWANDKDGALPGVAHDIEWFRWICSGSGSGSSIALQTLTDATHRIIRSNILDMFENALPGTAVILYFNGHGINNSFLLYNGTRVDAEILVGWIAEIRKETDKYLPVCIIFDHCLFESRAPIAVDLSQDIHILWACMPGQGSPDFRLAGDEDPHIPYSNTLKVFSLVLDEVQRHPAGFADDLMLRMNAWMDVVARMMRAEECRMNECLTPCPLCSCPSYESCTHSITRARHKNPLAYPRAQNPNGMFSGVEDGVCASQLLESIMPVAGPLLDRMQETAEKIKSHAAYQAINNVTAPPNQGSQFQSAHLQVLRGRNTDAAALPTQTLPF